MLIAVILANTLVPHGRLNGSALRVSAGTVHVKEIEVYISQFVKS